MPSREHDGEGAASLPHSPVRGAGGGFKSGAVDDDDDDDDATLGTEVVGGGLSPARLGAKRERERDAKEFRNQHVAREAPDSSAAIVVVGAGVGHGHLVQQEKEEGSSLVAMAKRSRTEGS